jgi:hypothetical protein
MAAGEAVDLWIRQRREIVLQDDRSKGFQSDAGARSGRAGFETHRL